MYDVRIYITVAFKIPGFNVCMQQVQLKIEKLNLHLRHEAGHTVNDAIHKRGASLALVQPHVVAAQTVVRSGSSPGPTDDPDLSKEVDPGRVYVWSSDGCMFLWLPALQLFTLRSSQATNCCKAMLLKLSSSRTALCNYCRARQAVKLPSW